MGHVRALGYATFASLSVRNFRIYYIGQGISLCGSWMQNVALSWLVLVLTGSGVQLGSVLAVHYLPVFFGSPLSGIIIDRLDKRRILYVTQTGLALSALVLSVLIYSGRIEVWMVYAFAFLTGMFNTLDRPTRLTFVHEMVGPEFLRNAVTLNSTAANLARAIGPMIAGVFIAGVGIAFCFLANALSFVAVLIMLFFIRAEELHKEESDRSGDHLFAVFKYVASVPDIRNTLIAVALIGTFAFEFPVSLPLLTRMTFMGDAAVLASLFTSMGIGSVVGGLFAASRMVVARGEFVVHAFLFGVSVCLTALMPSIGTAIAGMFFVGFFAILVSSVGSTMIQLASAAHMRGRVMSLWSLAIFGSTLIGAPIIGAIAEHAGARWGVATGGIAALVAAGFAALWMLEGRQLLSVSAPIQIRREEAVAEDAKVR